MGDHGGAVVKELCYKSEGRWFDPSCQWIFHWHKILPIALDPVVDSASNRNEYQEHFLGVKAAGALGWQPYHHHVPLSWNLWTLTSWNPLGHSRPVTGLLYLFLRTSCTTSFNIQKFSVLPTVHLCVFCVALRKNGDFYTSHILIGFYKRGRVFTARYEFWCLNQTDTSDVWFTVHRNSVWIRKTN